MKCPRTGTDLKQITIDNITVDFSEACGGVWFDNYELKKFDEIHEESGNTLADLMEKHRDDSIDTSPRIKCPKCGDIVLSRYFYSPARTVEIDRCPACGGIWLDAGELASIREMFPTESDREKASQMLVEAVSKSQGLEQIIQESQQKTQTARQFANFFTWICPSKYIPGKQDGAAF